MNLLSSSILQVEQQKVPVFFAYSIHATLCLLVICSWLIVPVLFMTNFDLLYLSFHDSLEYIVCQHWKPLPNQMYFQTDFKVFKMYFQYLNTILLYFNPV